MRWLLQKDSFHVRTPDREREDEALISPASSERQTKLRVGRTALRSYFGFGGSILSIKDHAGKGQPGTQASA
jgi:hypothetical protein